MPIYEYACKHCDHTLDALHNMSDDPLLDCPECGKPALEKKLSAPRFRLKGSGWYETDFKKDNQRNVLKSDSEPAKTDSKVKKVTNEKASPPKKAAEKSVSKSKSEPG